MEGEEKRRKKEGRTEEGKGWKKTLREINSWLWPCSKPIVSTSFLLMR